MLVEKPVGEDEPGPGALATPAGPGYHEPMDGPLPSCIPDLRAAAEALGGRLTGALAQAAEAGAGSAAPTPTKPWWQIFLENGLGITLLFIFLTAIVGVVVKQRRRDRCLKLLDGHHVSYLDQVAGALWGDLRVFSQGLDLTFDAPHRNRRGLSKSSVLIYPQQYEQMLSICRVDQGLTEPEQQARVRQVRRTFRPNVLRRGLRSIRNLLGTLQDAFSKAIQAIIGAVARMRPAGSVVETQQAGVQEISGTLLTAAANAYEPLLEAHIGKPVVLSVTPPGAPEGFELPGYLVDYTDRFVAVFNVDHELERSLELEVDEAAGDLERENARVSFSGDDVVVTCTGPFPLLLRSMESGGDRRRLEAVLAPSSKVSLARGGAAKVKLELSVARRIDVVCPRSLATVRFGAEERTVGRAGWLGRAPEAACGESGAGDPLAADSSARQARDGARGSEG